jgi:hypothetical protein
MEHLQANGANANPAPNPRPNDFHAQLQSYLAAGGGGQRHAPPPMASLSSVQNQAGFGLSPNGISYQPNAQMPPPPRVQVPQHQQLTTTTPNNLQPLLQALGQQLNPMSKEHQLLETIKLLADINPGVVTSALTQALTMTNPSPQQQGQQQPGLNSYQQANLQPTASQKNRQSEPSVQVQQLQGPAPSPFVTSQMNLYQQGNLQPPASIQKTSQQDISAPAPSPFVTSQMNLYQQGNLQTPASIQKTRQQDLSAPAPSPFVMSQMNLYQQVKKRQQEPSVQAQQHQARAPSPFSSFLFGPNSVDQGVTSAPADNMNSNVAVQQGEKSSVTWVSSVEKGRLGHVDDVKKAKPAKPRKQKKVATAVTNGTLMNTPGAAAQAMTVGAPPIHTPDEAVLKSWTLKQLGELYHIPVFDFMYTILS